GNQSGGLNDRGTSRGAWPSGAEAARAGARRGRGGGEWRARARAACVRVAVRCVEQLGAELGAPLTEDGLMKMMALLGWNHGPSSVEMGKGLNKYPPVEWSSIWGPLHAGACGPKGVGPRRERARDLRAVAPGHRVASWMTGDRSRTPGARN